MVRLYVLVLYDYYSFVKKTLVKTASVKKVHYRVNPPSNTQYFYISE